MIKSKIYRCISTLDKYEKKAFAKFLSSPYFNVNDSLAQLYQIICEVITKPESFTSKENIWIQVNTNTTFDDTKYRKLNSDLLKLFEKFITIESFQNDRKLSLIQSLKAINDRQLNLLYSSIKSKVDKMIDRTIDKSADHYYYQYEIEKLKFDLKSEFEIKGKGKDFQEEFNISDISSNLDIFYLSEKLKYVSTTLSWSKIYKIEVPSFDISPIEKIVSERKEIIPPIAIYYQIYLTLTDSDEIRHFNILLKLINRYIDDFPPKEQRYIYDSAVSYGVGKVNAGFLELQRPTFELYKQALKSEGFYEDGYLPESSFRNVIFFALRNEEYEWAEQFINDYASDLLPDIRANAVSFNLARIKFYKKEFEQVISLTQSVEYKDVVYNLNSRSFLLASYYELEEFDSLDALINSTNIYLRRNRSISETRKKLMLNQNKFIRKLMKVNQNDKSEIQKLKEELEAATGVVSKPWILEKINELL